MLDRLLMVVRFFSKELERIVGILYGADGAEPSQEDISKLAQEIYSTNLLTGKTCSKTFSHLSLAIRGVNLARKHGSW